MYVCIYVCVYIHVHSYRGGGGGKAETGYLTEGNSRSRPAFLVYCKAVGIAWIPERTK